MAGAYTFLAADLMTNAILAELPLSQVGFDNRLNSAGSFTGRLALGDPRVRAIDPRGSTQPGRTALYVDRDGRLIWGGIVWTRRYDSNSKELEVSALEFWSYFAHRIVVPPSGGVYSFLAQDEIVIATALINDAMSKNGSPSIAIGGAAGAGVTIDQVINDYELKVLSQVVEQIAAQQSGFDFTVDVAYAGGVPARTLTFSYPRRGVPALTSGLLFDLPGNVLNYTISEDATRMGNQLYLYGAGAGNVMLRSAAADPTLLGNSSTPGYPLLEAALSSKDQATQAVLDRYTQAQLSALKTPVLIPTLTVEPGSDPVLGGYTVGDEARLRIADEYFTTPLDTSYRIAGIKVTPQSEGTHEMATLTMTNPWTG